MEALKRTGRVCIAFLNSLKIRIFGFLNDASPYQPNLSGHAVLVPLLISLIGVLSLSDERMNENMHLHIDKDDIVPWSEAFCLILFYYLLFDRAPRFIIRAEGPLACIDILLMWFTAWLSFAFVTLHMFPNSFSSARSISVAKNTSLLVSTFASSIICLLAFHFIFKGLQNILPCEARKRPHISNIIVVSAAVSFGCFFFWSACGSIPLDEPRHLKGKFCSSGLITVKSAYYYHYLRYLMPEQYRYNRKLAGSERPAGSSDETFLFLPWATFIGLYIANYVVETSLGFGNEENEQRQPDSKPDFLNMAHWYSGTSADLYKTAFDLLVSVTIFLGRFDMRLLKAALNQHQNNEETKGDYLYDHFSGEKELWFDFMADTGDGGNSTYTVARLLAQPKILVTDPDPSSQPNQVTDSEPAGAQNQDTKTKLNLKRGQLLLIGGDLAYPNPSEFTYERRLFRPFQDALHPPPNHEWMTVNKYPSMPKPYEVPQCFVIPGNHDWFDGLRTFSRNICHRCWLGGWYMPQKKSYFALKLPKRWWIFSLDLALDDDIDVYQFEFFSKLANEEVGKEDSVIIMTHQPDWLVDWYENVSDQSKGKNFSNKSKGKNFSNMTHQPDWLVDWYENVSDQSKGKNFSNLLYNILKERCKLRIAGDIHHYMHHVAESSQTKGIYVHHLLVNGCGGAFTHPTHVFRDFEKSRGVRCQAAYPSFGVSKRLAFKNISDFCSENWRFEYVGGIIYIMLVFSMLPQCPDPNLRQVPILRRFFGALGNAFIFMLGDSYVSLGVAMLLFLVAYKFAPSKVSCKNRIMIGVLHASVHLAAALIIMLIVEFSIETTVKTEVHHSLYESHRLAFHAHLPVSFADQDRIKQWTFWLYQRYLKYFMFAFDAPAFMAVTRSNICKNGMESISRWDAILYYAPAFLYLYTLSSLAASLVLGIYLYICVRWFNLHYDEAFSSLRIADYKAFTRFHINHKGDLEVFTLAVDKVPRKWELDPEWKGLNSDKLGHHRENPSQWKAAASDEEPLKTVKIIDKFVIPRTREDSPDDTSGTATEVPGTEQNSLDEKKQKEKETTLEIEGKTNVDQTVAAEEIQEVEERQSEAK